MEKTGSLATMGSVIALAVTSVVLADAGGVQAKAEAAVEQDSRSEYVVVNGDTLASIALKVSGNEKDWIEIARANNLDGIDKSELLKAGTRLTIPANLRKS